MCHALPEFASKKPQSTDMATTDLQFIIDDELGYQLCLTKSVVVRKPLPT